MQKFAARNASFASSLTTNGTTPGRRIARRTERGMAEKEISGHTSGAALLQHFQHNLIVSDRLRENLQQISDLTLASWGYVAQITSNRYVITESDSIFLFRMKTHDHCYFTGKNTGF